MIKFDFPPLLNFHQNLILNKQLAKFVKKFDSGGNFFRKNNQTILFTI